ncbi:MAG: sigma-54 dependent transcriptional regulator [Isosphaeraceae bacterium]
MSQPRILIVHPERSSLALLSSMLKSLGHVIEEVDNDRVALRILERGGIDMILAGVDHEDSESLELLSYVKRKHREVPVILLFSVPNPERAREAMRLGALSVLRYPVPANELRAAVSQGLETFSIRTEGGNGRPALEPATRRVVVTARPAEPTDRAQSSTHGQTSSPSRGQATLTKTDQLARELGVLGSDPSLRVAIEMAGTMAHTRTPVLIVGERGTGKALLARTIHGLGAEVDRPFVSVDCLALTEATLERERNRATGGFPQPRAEPGYDWASKLAQAKGGTLFLNEVASLSDGLQLELLEVLQEREGDSGPHGQGSSADVRCLMSTSENLFALVQEGKFRQDLYHRVSVVCLKLPPLRHRGGDIEQLAEYFRARFSLDFGKNVVGFTADAVEILAKHDWPGNIRELEGAIQRGVALCQGTRITSGHISPSLCQSRSSRSGSHQGHPHIPLKIRPLKESLEEPEKRIIIQALQALNWNRQETARILDINRTTLYKKMKKYGLLVDEPIWVN